MPTIPNGIEPVVESYQIGSPEGVLRTEVGGGLPRYSLDWEAGMQPFRVSLALDPLQLAIWTAFYHHTVKKGTIAFDMPLDSGFGSAMHSVQIADVPSASRQGEVTKVTFTVMAWGAVYARTELEALDEIDAYNGYAAGATPAIPRGMRPVVEGYGYSGPTGATGGQIAGGSPRYALEWDRGAQQFRVTLVLTAAQFRIWSLFFHFSARKGAVSFEMPLDSGMGEEPHLVNIMPGSYSAVRNGCIWVVSFGVEAESTVYAMSAADAAAMISLYNSIGPEMAALLRRIDVFANHDTLVLQ